jgi:hypothetical protein
VTRVIRSPSLLAAIFITLTIKKIQNFYFVDLDIDLYRTFVSSNVFGDRVLCNFRIIPNLTERFRELPLSETMDGTRLTELSTGCSEDDRKSDLNSSGSN